MSASGRLGLPLEIHELGVQTLVRGGEMLQQGGALPVEANAPPDHAGQQSENREIEITAGYEKSDLAARHHRSTLAGSIANRGCPSCTWGRAMTDRVRIRLLATCRCELCFLIGPFRVTCQTAPPKQLEAAAGPFLSRRRHGGRVMVDDHP